eukprot:7450942-Alexandrium_andersonii.AAC.1
MPRDRGSGPMRFQVWPSLHPGRATRDFHEGLRAMCSFLQFLVFRQLRGSFRGNYPRQDTTGKIMVH